MKKNTRHMAILIIMMLAAMLLSGCKDSPDMELSEPKSEVVAETQIPEETTGYQPRVYTEEEIQAAIDVAKVKFAMSFEGCELLRMEYIEGKYLSDYEYYAKRCAVDKVIVLESDYYAGPDASPSLNQNHTYDNWKWILIDDGSGWSVWTNGYA